MKRFDVITIGSVTRDVFLRSRQIKVVRDGSFSTGEAECFALGSKIEVDDIVFETGGGGGNTAVGFARQGLRTAMIGKIGAHDARGQEILNILKTEGVETSGIVRDRRKMSGYSVLLLTGTGERTALVYRGASADFQLSDIRLGAWRAKWLYVSSLGGSLSVLRKIWAYAKATKTKIAWNPGRGELERGLTLLRPFLRQADFFSVNQEEAAALLQTTRHQDRSVFEQLRTYVGGITLVTQGTEGSLAGLGPDAWHSRTNNVPVVDTTGAGDAFGCGFIGTYIKTKGHIPPALQMATANSESVIQVIGAKNGLLTTAAMKRAKKPVVDRL